MSQKSPSRERAAMKRKDTEKDFCKTKLKVGKTKAAPSNATKTDISAKSLYIPEQSVVKDRKGQLKSVRGLTLSDLLVQTRHYNANTRRDALVGIRELSGKEFASVFGRMGEIFDNCLKLMIDPEEAVRNALFAFLKDIFSSKTTSNDFASFREKIMTFILASLAHLNEEIRFGGLRYLELILQKKILNSISNYKSKIFNSLLFILNAKKKNPSHLESILLVIDSLLEEFDAKNPYKMLANQEENAMKLVVPAESVLFECQENWNVDSKFLSGLFCGFACGSGGVANGKAAANQESELGSCLKFIQMLIQRLMEMWLENSQELLMNENKVQREKMKMLLFIVNALKRCTKFLFFSQPEALTEELGKSIQKRMLQNFPFGNDSIASWEAKGSKTEMSMMYLEMNFEFIEMNSLFGRNMDNQKIVDYLKWSFENCKQLGKSIESVQKSLVFCYFVFTSEMKDDRDIGRKRELMHDLEFFRNRQSRNSQSFLAVDKFLQQLKALKRDYHIGKVLGALFE